MEGKLYGPSRSKAVLDFKVIDEAAFEHISLTDIEKRCFSSASFIRRSQTFMR